MREQRVGLPFIVLLHCPRPRGTLWGSNNFLTSSCQMQNIPANGMGCVLVSCTAAFWFPGLCHVLSHRKASLSAGMRGPRISGADTRQRRQKTQPKCWRQPVQAGGVHLGHSCGLVCGKVVRKWAPLSCFSSACPRTAVREDLPHAFLLLPPSLSDGRSSLHAGGLPLGGVGPHRNTNSALRKILLASLASSPLCAVPAGPQARPGACLGPGPSPGYLSPLLPVWSPASPPQSPHLLMFSWLSVSVQIFAWFQAGMREPTPASLYLCDPHHEGVCRS